MFRSYEVLLFSLTFISPLRKIIFIVFISVSKTNSSVLLTEVI
ncbi:hypothetical protein [Lactococcus lactis]|nr:hypothetical protein [Lactococcus lactis]KST78929.1 hypothetical protein LK231_1314 [Lactococcus lactis subsp. lactis]